MKSIKKMQKIRPRIKNGNLRCLVSRIITKNKGTATLQIEHIKSDGSLIVIKAENMADYKKINSKKKGLRHLFKKKKYEEISLIKQTRNGKIYLIKIDKQFMVVKEIELMHSSLDEQVLVINDINIRRRLAKKKYIIGIKDIIIKEYDKIFIFMEYAQNQDLFYSYLDSNNINLKSFDDEAFLLIGQIIEGICNIHSAEIIHGDLKPENILLDNGTIKITDFEMSQICQAGGKTYCESRGTLEYSSPEALAGDSYYSNDVAKKRDVFALGIIIWDLVVSTSPFDDVGMVEKTAWQLSKARKTYFYLTKEEKREIQHKFRVDTNNYYSGTNLNREKKLINLSKMCMRTKVEKRPSIFQVKKIYSQIK
ncbi:protein kinase [Candidatus Margulisiibacteriota bacterium]